MLEPHELTELLALADDGDQAAWDEIVDRFTNLLWSIGRAHRLNAADVSDVVQTTWLRLVENLGRIRDPERLAGWLATTARRECLRVLRASGREATGWTDDLVLRALDDPAADGRAIPLDVALLEEERDAQLWRCFTRLSEQCQHLLRVLMASEPSTYAEVSQTLGVPIGSIGPTRGRCLDQLRQIARELGYEFDSVK